MTKTGLFQLRFSFYVQVLYDTIESSENFNETMIWRGIGQIFLILI